MGVPSDWIAEGRLYPGQPVPGAGGLNAWGQPAVTPPATAPTATCPDCGLEFHVHRGGRILPNHGAAGNRCPGSYKPIKEHVS